MKLYSKWVQKRLDRPPAVCRDRSGKEVDWKEEKTRSSLGSENFNNVLLKPREEHLSQLREAGDLLTTADKAALLVMMELPMLEASSLVETLSQKLLEDPDATHSCCAPG